MILRSLSADNFRNLEPARHEFHPNVNIAVGSNGQGKTNLLEAIYFLATTRSFRTARLASLFRFDTSSIFVTGEIERGGVTRTQSIGLETGESRRRVLMLNGEKVPLTPYLNATSVFAYSQSRLEIVRGAPEERRRFLDRGIASVSPGYLDELARYGRVLKQRNALLHAIGSGEAAGATLDVWNDEFVAAAAVIHRARAAYAGELADAFAAIVARHRYHVSGLEMIYRGAGDAPELAGHLERIRRHEIRARMSLVGPQRDSIDFLVAGRPASEVLSGGELKMVVLFLKFAKVELFRRRFDDAPLFLLDDVDAELDLQVLEKLLRGLPSETQLFATSAKESFLAALEAGPHRRLTIDNGRLIAAVDFA